MTNETMIVEGLAKEIAKWFDKLWAEESRFDQSEREYRNDCAKRAARLVLREFMVDTFPKLVTESVARAIQAQRRKFMEIEDHD